MLYARTIRKMSEMLKPRNGKKPKVIDNIEKMAEARSIRAKTVPFCVNFMSVSAF